MEIISSFRRQYECFSNFCYSPFYAYNIFFEHNEKFFHWQKALFFRDARRAKDILDTTDPNDAKQLGRKVDGFDKIIWHQNCLDIMWEGLQYKFNQNKDFKEILINSAPAFLVEGNHWKDTFWGYDTNLQKGQNNLGILLMSLRNMYMNEAAANLEIPFK